MRATSGHGYVHLISSQIKHYRKKRIAYSSSKGVDKSVKEYFFAIFYILADKTYSSYISGKRAGADGGHQSQDDCCKKGVLRIIKNILKELHLNNLFRTQQRVDS